MKGNGDGKALRFARMTKADVATLLAHGYVNLPGARIRSAPEMTGSRGLIG